MDNVIPFPKINQKTPIQIKDVDDKIQQLKNHHINETLATVIPMLFSYLESAGFDFESMDDDESGMNDPNVKDGAFMVEAIRSLLCKHHNMEHPFQQISENIFEADNSNKGVFNLAKKLNIEFKTLEKGTS